MGDKDNALQRLGDIERMIAEVRELLTHPLVMTLREDKDLQYAQAAMERLGSYAALTRDALSGDRNDEAGALVEAMIMVRKSIDPALRRVQGRILQRKAALDGPGWRA